MIPSQDGRKTRKDLQNCSKTSLMTHDDGRHDLLSMKWKVVAEGGKESNAEGNGIMKGWQVSQDHTATDRGSQMSST